METQTNLSQKISFSREVKNYYPEILTDDALTFLEALQDRFNKKRFALLKNRENQQHLFDLGMRPSFNWAAKLTVTAMETFREELAAMGYKFQFITLAGFHTLNTSMFELSKAYKERGRQDTLHYKKENLRCKKMVLKR